MRAHASHVCGHWDSRSTNAAQMAAWLAVSVVLGAVLVSAVARSGLSTDNQDTVGLSAEGGAETGAEVVGIGSCVGHDVGGGGREKGGQVNGCDETEGVGGKVAETGEIGVCRPRLEAGDDGRRAGPSSSNARGGSDRGDNRDLRHVPS